MCLNIKAKMSKLFLFIIVLTLFFSGIKIKAQSDFYDNNYIREVKIYFSQPNWDYILDSLFIAGQEERLLASLEIDGVSFDSVGVRYKGYSSVDTANIKNPFNIKLDYIISNQDYHGIEKLKLSNVIHDPSFVREVLSYEIARKYMPASNANYANVYVNDTLLGLYNNVQAVNKNFSETYFGIRDNVYFKGNPDVLDYPMGSNSNLQYYNSDTTAYYPYYTLKSDSGWTELYNLINILNNQTDSIEYILNVDRTLWMLAFDYSLVNLDSYIAYAQNYYLFMDQNGRFNPILWDLNMSIGSFRLSDGGTSAMTGGISIPQAKNLNPCGLLTYSVSPRPLIKKIINDPTKKRMYLAHIRTIVNENFVSGEYYTRSQALQMLIDTSVQNDSNKFYSYNDFVFNIDVTVGGTSGMIQYPGIQDFVEGRTSYLNSYSGFQGEPSINIISDTVVTGNNIWVSAKINYPDSCFLAYRYGIYDVFDKVKMYDDGAHNDGIAGDSIFGASIPKEVLIQYYIYAENTTAGAFSPKRAEYEFHTIQQILPSNIVINEFMANNQSYITDNAGEYEDWIELYNNANEDFNLSGLYLSDDKSNLMKWPFPDTIIGANDYLVIWADNDILQEGLHSNFKLSKSGEAIYLSYSTENILDSVLYDIQIPDFTTGRYPNGTGSFGVMEPTISASNSPFSVEELEDISDINIYPNPVNNILNIASNGNLINTVEIFDLYGRLVLQENNETDFLNIDVSSLNKGMYVIRINENYIEKIIVD